MMDFDFDRNGTGTLEWADFSENIARGCANGCLYCYASHNAITKFKTVKDGDWCNEVLTRRASMSSYPKRDGIIMFPTTHDITPFNVDDCIRVLLLMLNAGNHVLIVSKPRIDCITKVLHALSGYKDQVMFRYTIGTCDPITLRFWEPNASSVSERLHALELTKDAGFKTSVSIEPMLGSITDTIALVDILDLFVTNSIWIGKMNKVNERVVQTSKTIFEKIQEIEKFQSDENILKLVDKLSNNPKVYWKDSIKDVIAKHIKLQVI